MKRLLLLSFVAMSLFACKDDKNDTPTPTVDYKDPKVLSGALTVKSGTAVTGTMPVGTGAAGAPVLDAATNNQVLPAINGRYAVIAPELTDGQFKGYYVKVAGADNYFKVEFPAKAGGRKAKGPKHSLLRNDGPDSLIVIKLPESLNIDTFKIQYAAYDSSNVVSNVINASVVVLNPAGGADGTALVGTWSISREKGPAPDDQWYTQLGMDTAWSPISCVNEKLQYDQNNGTPTITGYYNTLKDQYTFAANGSSSWDYLAHDSYLDWINSTCGDLKFIDEDLSYSDKGGWSYIAATKQLTIVGDGDGNVTVNDFSASTVTVTEITATKLVIVDSYGYTTELVKK